MKKRNHETIKKGIILFAVSIAVQTLLCLLCALLVKMKLLGQDAIPTLSFAAVAVTSFVCVWVFFRFQKEQKWQIAAIGESLFLLTRIAAFFISGNEDVTLLLPEAAAIILLSAAGMIFSGISDMQKSSRNHKKLLSRSIRA